MSSPSSMSGRESNQTALSGDPQVQSWELLAQRLEDFIAAWESGEPPQDFAAFLLDLPAAVKPLAIVEFVKVDLDYRYRAGQPLGQRRMLEDYVGANTLLNVESMPVDLIFEEFHIRKVAGEPVVPQEYLERFPNQAEELRRLMAIDSPTSSSALIARRAGVDLQAGDEVDDFLLLAMLGRGAFASVFLARQKSMQRLVALKISRDRGMEPQTLAQLDHPHIVRIFDQRKVPGRQERLMYMQYVGGDTLEALIRQSREVPTAERTGKLALDVIQSGLDRGGGLVTIDIAVRKRLAAVDWLEVVCQFGVQIAAALEYAHTQGVLHRDVKPANVLLGADGCAKLADFNISFSSHLPGDAAAAYFGGSLAYMSPEQLEASNPEHPRRADELDGRSDVYALGVVLYELLLGVRPFGVEEFAGSWSETLEAMTLRRRRGVNPPAELPDSWRRLRNILVRCLAPERDQRFASAEELSRELQLCLHPQAAELLDVESSRVRSWVARYPMFFVLTAALIPNALAGAFNFFYNYERMKHVQLDAFWTTQLAVNATAFPLGLVIVTLLARPMNRALASRASLRDETADPARIARRTLYLGDGIAVLGIVEWAVAGMAYPISLHVLVGGLGVSDYVHFLMSLLLCGLIAAAYPFFLLGFLATRVFFPALYAARVVGPPQIAELDSMVRRAAAYLFIAGGVPALAMAVLVTAGSASDALNRFALIALSVFGVVGFGAVMLLYRAMQRDSIELDRFRI